MKIRLLNLFFVFAITSIYAQDVILTFEGIIEGTSTSVPMDKVTIENLTQGGITEMTESYSYNLTTGEVLSVDDINQEIVQRGFQKVYPNPFNSNLNIDFFTEGVGLTNVTVYNTLGQEISKYSKTMEKGIHKLNFSPNQKGLYLVVLSDNGKTYDSRVISSQNGYSKM